MRIRRRAISLFAAIAMVFGVLAVLPASSVIAATDSDAAGVAASPDGSLVFALYVGADGLSYDITKNGEIAVARSSVGLTTVGAGVFSGAGLTVGEPAATSGVEAFTLVTGKQLAVSEEYAETAFPITDAEGKTADLIVRVFDEGLGMRFALYDVGADAAIPVGTYPSSVAARVKGGDITAFTFEPDAAVWHSPHNTAWDSPYVLAAASELSADTRYGYNMNPLIRPYADKDLYVQIYQVTDDADYPARILMSGGDGSFYADLTRHQTTAVPIEAGDGAPFMTPWNAVAVGTAADIVESTLAESLAEPATIGDEATGVYPEWLAPGPSSWTWMNRDPNNNLQRFKEYVDLASDLGWKYVLVDEGWQLRSGAWANSVHGYYGIQRWALDLVDYAKTKGVGILVWFHRGDVIYHADDDGYDGRPIPNTRNLGRRKTYEEMVANLQRYKDAGFVGVKVDFFPNDNLSTRGEVLDAIKACGDVGLMVNFHGQELFSGARRTYPQLVSVEAVYGEEAQLWDHDNGNALTFQQTILPFVRSSTGPLDFTPSHSFQGNDYINARPGYSRTLAASAAQVVLYENGLPCMADTVENYRGSKILSFFKNLPAAWDETRLLDGAPGDYVVMARRAGDDWYVGAATTGQAMEYELSLDFLGEGEYNASVYMDGETRDADRYFPHMVVDFRRPLDDGYIWRSDGLDVWTPVETQFTQATRDSVINLNMLERGGAVVKISRAPNNETWTDDSAEIKTDLSGRNVSDAIELDLASEIRTYLRFDPQPDQTPVEWSVSDPAIVEATDLGSGVLLKGLATGSATLTAVNPLNGASVSAQVNVNTVPVPAEPWTVDNPLPHKVSYNGAACATVVTDVGVWNWGNMNRSYDELARKVRNLHLAEADTRENMEISCELTFSPGLSGRAAGIVFYLDDLNMVALQKRMTSATASRLEILGNAEGVGNNAGRPVSTLNPYAAETSEQTGQTVELRLVKTGASYAGYYRYAGETEWTQIFRNDVGSYDSEAIGAREKIKVGFYAYTGRTGWDIFYNQDHAPATFENFTINGVAAPFAVVPDTSAVVERAADGETASAVFAVANGSGSDALRAQCILASYDVDGRLADVKIETVDVPPGGDMYALDIAHGGGAVKAFIWDAAFAPLCEAAERSDWR